MAENLVTMPRLWSPAAVKLSLEDGTEMLGLRKPT
jgi:hypothetical protein